MIDANQDLKDKLKEAEEAAERKILKDRIEQLNRISRGQDPFPPTL